MKLPPNVKEVKENPCCYCGGKGRHLGAIIHESQFTGTILRSIGPECHMCQGKGYRFYYQLDKPLNK